jgi:hypothetical protein
MISLLHRRKPENKKKKKKRMPSPFAHLVDVDVLLA